MYRISSLGRLVVSLYTCTRSENPKWECCMRIGVTLSYKLGMIVVPSSKEGAKPIPNASLSAYNSLFLFHSHASKYSLYILFFLTKIISNNNFSETFNLVQTLKALMSRKYKPLTFGFLDKSVPLRISTVSHGQFFVFKHAPFGWLSFLVSFHEAEISIVPEHIFPP